jgi:hypothetical protein
MARRVLRYEVVRDGPTMMHPSAMLLPEAQIRVRMEPGPLGSGGMLRPPVRRDDVHVWAQVEDGAQLRGRMLHVVCTGDPIPDDATWLATATLDASADPSGSPLVLHVYDQGWVA